jgi:hypothetical protein
MITAAVDRKRPSGGSSIDVETTGSTVAPQRRHPFVTAKDMMRTATRSKDAIAIPESRSELEIARQPNSASIIPVVFLGEMMKCNDSVQHSILLCVHQFIPVWLLFF